MIQSKAENTPPPSLPALDRADYDLLNTFLAHRGDIHAISAATGRPLADIVHWASEPHIAAWLAAERALTLAAAARENVDQTLNLLRNATDPIERRRLATALTRAIAHARDPKPATPRRRKPDPAAATQPDQAAAADGSSSASTSDVDQAIDLHEVRAHHAAPYHPPASEQYTRNGHTTIGLANHPDPR